jgi:hypothetical protein
VLIDVPRRHDEIPAPGVIVISHNALAPLSQASSSSGAPGNRFTVRPKPT